MNPVIHFGMPAVDRNRMANFYATVFGWRTKQFGPETGNYILATTTETDEKGMSKTPGAINGGFFAKTEKEPYPKITIGVDDIDKAIEAVKANGGTIVRERVDMSGIGSFASCKDTEGEYIRLDAARPSVKKF